ncbi:MAG: hypothetical protein Q8L26_04215 [Candidatus Omnitrophota bacterium]|nr:hypothetical protein [Candidatus Omnitrophota bacterium]
MDNLDYDAQQRREVFAMYGLAMYHAQCFEKSLVILVSVAFNKEYFKSNYEKREELFSDTFKKTAGQLVEKLKVMVKVPNTLENDLSKAVKKRNWLAHDYFWGNSYDILTTAGRERKLNELHEISEYFSKMDERMTKIYQRVFDKIGLTEDKVMAYLEKMVDKHKI